MFTLFKSAPVVSETNKEVTTIVKNDPKPSIAPISNSTNDLVKEIHESFFTEVDRLLAEAKITPYIDPDLKQGENIYKRLVSLGFHNTKTCNEVENKAKTLDDINEKISINESIVNAITYFSKKYPKYKFITEESVKKICKKYGLVYGIVRKYTGEIPIKNLEEIEAFKVDDIDISYHIEAQSTTSFNTSVTPNVSKKKAELAQGNSHSWIKIHKASLEIAAPVKDFNLNSTELKDFKLQDIPRHVPDPVVLQPVIYNDVKYYLIVTAWGLEAEDELVINQF
jgi:hypothetical protein